MSERPLLGITMGDPAGVGPEITVKALSHREVYRKCRPLVIGHQEIMARAVKQFGQGQQIRRIETIDQAAFQVGQIELLVPPGMPEEIPATGQISASAGKMAFLCIEQGIALCREGKLHGLVTNPIHKEALHLAGYSFAGHTEILAHYTNSPSVSMLLVHENIRIAHVSTHVSLLEACRRVKKARVLEVIRLLHQACRDFGIARPRIAVAGLNPHASDGGLFGQEEATEIEPAIQQAREEGIQVVGPVSPDTVYSQLKDGLYDGCVAMYHDQGHIPFKMLTFHWERESGRILRMQGVNVTLGLPMVRTSVDHGTAFDIAWQGKASEAPLLEAIEVAIQLAAKRMGQSETARKR